MTSMPVHHEVLDRLPAVAAQAVRNYLEHRETWRDQPEMYWLARLAEEVGELGSALVGRHEHSPALELTQIAGLAINWLEMREVTSQQPSAKRAAIERATAMLPAGYQVVTSAGLAQFRTGEEAARRALHEMTASANYQGQQFTEFINAIWGSIYKNREGWEYPAMVIRHVQAVLAEKDARIAELEQALAKSNEHIVALNADLVRANATTARLLDAMQEAVAAVTPKAGAA